MAAWKDPVRVATTGANIQLKDTQIIDGVALAVGDRVLVKDQSNASENGIYVVASGQWPRASDANTSALMEPQMMVRVSEGAANGSEAAAVGGTAWLLANSAPITLGSTDLYFVPSDILKQDRFGQLMDFQANSMSDGDIFAISNFLQDGQSDNSQAYLASSLAGYGGICTGVRGRNGNGSSILPQVGVGVYADSDNGYGLFAASDSNIAVQAVSNGNLAVQAISTAEKFDTILAQSSSSAHAAVSAQNGNGGYGLWAHSPKGTAIYGNGSPAGYFDGDVFVTGDVVLANSGGDVAEDFDIEDPAVNTEPGTVLVISENGNLRASDIPYDTRVAGVIAGAGTIRPAVILQRLRSREHRSPVALVGKVFCKADATMTKIVAGDLLTTSSTPGHAMKATDTSRAVGAIVGKALASLDSGLGLIPILVSPR